MSSRSPIKRYRDDRRSSNEHHHQHKRSRDRDYRTYEPTQQEHEYHLHIQRIQYEEHQRQLYHQEQQQIYEQQQQQQQQQQQHREWIERNNNQMIIETIPEWLINVRQIQQPKITKLMQRYELFQHDIIGNMYAIFLIEIEKGISEFIIKNLLNQIINSIQQVQKDVKVKQQQDEELQKLQQEEELKKPLNDFLGVFNQLEMKDKIANKNIDLFVDELYINAGTSCSSCGFRCKTKEQNDIHKDQHFIQNIKNETKVYDSSSKTMKTKELSVRGWDFSEADWVHSDMNVIEYTNYEKREEILQQRKKNVILKMIVKEDGKIKKEEVKKLFFFSKKFF